MAAVHKKFRKKKFTQISVYNMYAKYMLKRGLGSKSKKFLRSIIFNIKVKQGMFHTTVLLAFERGRPLTFFKSLRLGGTKYQVPCGLLVQRYMLWSALIFVKVSPRKFMPKKDKIVKLILDAYDFSGVLMDRKAELHKIMVRNRGLSRLI